MFPVPRRRKPRGYPVAILIGLENKVSIFWNVYSKSVKPGAVKHWIDNEFNFFESMVDELRPSIKHGVKTVLLVSESKRKYDGFIEHIEKHQKWMLGGYELNRVSFQFLEGSAKNVDTVKELVNASGFKKSIEQGVREDLGLVISVLEKRFGSEKGIEGLLFSLREVEEALYNGVNLEYIVLSQEFLNKHRRRIQRILQIAENRGVKTSVIPSESSYISRISQFGGLIGLIQDT